MSFEDPNLNLPPPDIDHQVMDDRNFATGDLSQAMGILGLPKFLLRREFKDVEAYYIEQADKSVHGIVRWEGHGSWSIEGPPGRPLAMLWRQVDEATAQQAPQKHPGHLASLLHPHGYMRFDQARASGANASIYCVANLDRTVRLFLTFKGSEAILDTPTNRPVVMMAKGDSEGDVKFVDAYGDPVANVHTDHATYREVHEVTLLEPEDTFLPMIFGVALALEMNFRHGNWRSPYEHVQL